MISADVLRETFRRFRAANMHPPVDLRVDAEVATLAATWSEVWQDRTDAELVAACRAYLATDSRWWPSPGQLLALVPPRPVRQIEARTPMQRAERRMGLVTIEMYRADPTGETSREVLDQAIRDTMSACGEERCIGVDCEPCDAALADRLEELWAERSMPTTARRAV